MTMIKSPDSALKRPTLIQENKIQYPSVKDSTPLATILVASVAIAISAVLAIVVYSKAVYSGLVISDYTVHFHLMEHMEDVGRITLPHFLFHVLTIGLSRIWPFHHLQGPALLISVLSQVCYTLLLHILLWDKSKAMWQPWAALITLAVAYAAPISIFTYSSHDLYMGYIGMSVFHSPTLTLMKPLALAHFILISTEDTPTRKRLAGEAFLLILSMLAKPVYGVVLIAGCALVLILKPSGYRKIYLRLPWILVPVLIVVAFQYFFTYISPDPSLGSSGVQFAPLLGMRAAFYAAHALSPHLLSKLIASIAFPVVVLVLLRTTVMRSRSYVLSIGSLICGCILLYLFAEKGKRLIDLNFAWFAEIGLLLWFFESVRAVIQQYRGRQLLLRSWKVWMIAIVFFFHVLSGVVWYVSEVQRPSSMAESRSFQSAWTDGLTRSEA